MELNYEVVKILKQRNLKISTAESITGGKVISYLIEVPGASKVIEQSFVLYSDNAKITTLAIDKNLIEQYGVVSEQVALQMAKNLKIISKADVVLSTTGEAGPIVSDEKVIKGTVCFGMIIKEQEFTFKRIFDGDRLEIMESSVQFILKELINILK